jgi:UDP:flavonoid glycosyltransferase YjiC (YdhE family)
MKFVLAFYGSRGDIEPGVAVGRELLRNGHEVRMAVPPDMVGFVESAGLEAVGYGLSTRPWLDKHRDFYTRNFWNIPEAIKLWREVWGPTTECWEKISTTLMSLAGDADVLITGLSFEEPAANVAEYYDLPFATLHHFPARAHGQLGLPILPPPWIRSAMQAYEWLNWRMGKKVEDVQRRELGLTKATRPAPRRIAARGALEIQGYDEVCFPGLAAEWAKADGQRPFVGALTMEMTTDADEEIASWVAEGTPPIYFGFGSIPVESPAETVAMISAVCAELGERALVCAGWSDFTGVSDSERVKVVGAVNFTSIFPNCRAVVHHGGAGTLAAGLRAGVPQLILWTWPDQSLRGAASKRLKVGAARRFTNTNRESLVADLRRILAPDYAARARAIAPKTTKPAESAVAAAHLVEDFARLRRAG